MSYKHYNFSVIGRDSNSPYVRNHLWVAAFFQYPTLLDVRRPVQGIASRKDMIEYLTDLSTWDACHNDLEAKILADYHFLENLIDRTCCQGEETNQWTEENIFNRDLTELASDELLSLYETFIGKQSQLYALGCALPILDFQGFSFVEKNLEKILREKASAAEFQEYYQVFTQPVHNSFAQDQEEDLLKLMDKYCHQNGWRESESFRRDLSEHTKKYAWVYYVYAGPAFTEKDFLNFIEDYLKKGIEPNKKLGEIKADREVIKKKKQDYITEIQPDGFELAILNLAGKLVWGKPRRKDYQSKSYYHVEKLQREIGRRLYLSLEQVRSASLAILKKGLATGEVDTDKINLFFQSHICLPNDDGTLTILTGQEAKDFAAQFKEKREEKNEKEIIGACAYSGHARGKVKIINAAPDMHKMEYGDILVSTGTTPAIVMAMKKAAAMVTDEGGLTCHASIVSRELHIPCVVGTKIATQVLRDGDLVEVDAEKGIVKIIK